LIPTIPIFFEKKKGAFPGSYLQLPPGENFESDEEARRQGKAYKKEKGRNNMHHALTVPANRAPTPRTKATQDDTSSTPWNGVWSFVFTD